MPQPPCRTPPRRPRSPKRPTIHSIERCLASVSPRGARKSHTDDSRPRRSRPCRSSTMKYRPPAESSIRRCWVPALSDRERASPLTASLARDTPAHWQHLAAAEAQRRACSGHNMARGRLPRSKVGDTQRTKRPNPGPQMQGLEQGVGGAQPPRERAIGGSGGRSPEPPGRTPQAPKFCFSWCQRTKKHAVYVEYGRFSLGNPSSRLVKWSQNRHTRTNACRRAGSGFLSRNLALEAG